jgi:glycosyltransferase involved in cell wall biosynthesis
LKDHPDIRWIIIGDGRKYAWLQEAMKEHGLSAAMSRVGRVEEAKMPGLFAHADALLVTLRKEPTFALTIPTKVQAYMACGKPIVAALDGEGARIITESGAGIVVPPGDASALADAVLSLSRMPKRDRDVFGQRAVEYSKANFDRDKLIEELVALFFATISRRVEHAR